MPQISPIDPIGTSITRTQEMLFRPFRFVKWQRLAFVGTLVVAGEAGFDFVNSARVINGVAQPWDRTWQFIQANLAMVVTVAIFIVLLLTALYLLSRWLGSRATFVFFENVVGNNDRIVEPWREFRALGNSLFKFRLLMDLVTFNAYLLILIIAGAIAWPDIKASIIAEEFLPNTPTLIATIVGGIGVILWAITWWILSSIVLKLAVPVMYLRRMDAWPAVKETYRRYFRPNWGKCILFFLMMIVVTIARSIWTSLAMAAFLAITCCLGVLVLIIPIVGLYPVVLLTLPILTFERIYLLQFISQFDPALQIDWRSPLPTGFPITPDADLTSPDADLFP